MTQKPKDEQALLDAVAAMSEPDRSTVTRLHEIISTNAPSFRFRTWYGMPAYTDGDKIIAFIRGREKFGERYITLGFNPAARLDEGTLWPHDYALTGLTPDVEERIAALVRKSVGA